MALSNLLFPIIQGMVNVPGSLHFSGIWGTDLPISAETFLPMLIRSLPLSFLLLVHNSFKNLAYLEICFIAYNRGLITSTFQMFPSTLSLPLPFFCWKLLLEGMEEEGCAASANQDYQWKIHLHINC